MEGALNPRATVLQSLGARHDVAWPKHGILAPRCRPCGAQKYHFLTLAGSDRPSVPKCRNETRKQGLQLQDRSQPSTMPARFRNSTKNWKPQCHHVTTLSEEARPHRAPASPRGMRTSGVRGCAACRPTLWPGTRQRRLPQESGRPAVHCSSL